jgi:hypothetical protein
MSDQQGDPDKSGLPSSISLRCDLDSPCPTLRPRGQHDSSIPPIRCVWPQIRIASRLRACFNKTLPWDGEGELLAALPVVLVEQLELERAEEALSDRVDAPIDRQVDLRR